MVKDNCIKQSKEEGKRTQKGIKKRRQAIENGRRVDGLEQGS